MLLQAFHIRYFIHSLAQLSTGSLKNWSPLPNTHASVDCGLLINDVIANIHVQQIHTLFVFLDLSYLP